MWKTLVKILEKRACNHDWEIILQKDYEDQAPTSKWDDARKAHTRIVMMCKKCGKIETLFV